MNQAIRVNTFSIVACDLEEASWGVAVASKFLAVGAIVPFAKAGVGAIAVQSAAQPAYGDRGLGLMANGLDASVTLSLLLTDDALREERQIGIVDFSGNVATFTGTACTHWAGGATGVQFAIQGNVLAGEDVVHAMAKAFEESRGELADRLYVALLEGDHKGGDRRGKQSAALLVAKAGGSYGGTTDRYIDLRVDDHDEPVQQLGYLLELHHIFLGSSQQKDKVKIKGKLAMEFNQLLGKLGYYTGAVNETWGMASRQAFREFIEIENLEQRVDYSNDFIDFPAIRYIRNKFV